MADAVSITEVVGTLIDPVERVTFPLTGGAEDSFSIEVAGMGQLAGLAYTVPAHSTGRIKAHSRRRL